MIFDNGDLYLNYVKESREGCIFSSLQSLIEYAFCVSSAHLFSFLLPLSPHMHPLLPKNPKSQGRDEAS